MNAETLDLISSPQNPYVKDLVRLRKDGNARCERGVYWVEGTRSVTAALALRSESIVELIVCERMLGENRELLELAREKGTRQVRVSKDVFKKLADVKTPQGIAALIKIPQWSFSDLWARPHPIVVVGCGIQDPGNLGTLIRSCEAAGASGLITLEGSADPFNAKVVRSTAGGLLTLPMIRMSEIEFLKQAGECRLVAASAQGKTTYRSFDWKTRPLALCIGNEGAGLPARIAAACREQVSIPIRGKSESLNAAVAASILLFEAQASAG